MKGSHPKGRYVAAVIFVVATCTSCLCGQGETAIPAAAPAANAKLAGASREGCLCGHGKKPAAIYLAKVTF